MKTKERICGIMALLSFMWLIGVAGNSDLGLEADLGALIIKLLAGLAVCVCSIEIGGFNK